MSAERSIVLVEDEENIAYVVALALRNFAGYHHLTMADDVQELFNISFEEYAEMLEQILKKSICSPSMNDDQPTSPSESNPVPKPKARRILSSQKSRWISAAALVVAATGI